jgi:hypothetical protein
MVDSVRQDKELSGLGWISGLHHHQENRHCHIRTGAGVRYSSAILKLDITKKFPRFSPGIWKLHTEVAGGFLVLSSYCYRISENYMITCRTLPSDLG